ncbi:anti-repressor SinI family protein [Priestia megaterium]|nr:anti-repressor SinI family protein [Priestia megaterium]
MLEEENKLDQEWINLMKEAYQLGLTIVEIKKFIHSNQKKLISRW